MVGEHSWAQLILLGVGRQYGKFFREENIWFFLIMEKDQILQKQRE